MDIAITIPVSTCTTAGCLTILPITFIFSNAFALLSLDKHLLTDPGGIMKLRTASESVGWANSVGPLNVSPQVPRIALAGGNTETPANREATTQGANNNMQPRQENRQQV